MKINLYPESQHVFDWFHITMRLTVLKQYVKGVSKNAPEADAMEPARYALLTPDTHSGTQ